MPFAPGIAQVFRITMYKQNIEYCPATYRLVETMMEKSAAGEF
jgi:hypothetical protein